jgi:carboxypeptidase Q
MYQAIIFHFALSSDTLAAVMIKSKTVLALALSTQVLLSGQSLVGQSLIQQSLLAQSLSAQATSGQATTQNQQVSRQLTQFSMVPQMSPEQQANYSPQLLDQLKSIKEAALMDDYAYRQLAYLTENIGPRQTGSPQANAAAHYVADELRKLGLEVQLEEVKVPHWVRGVETAELVDYAGHVADTKQKIVLTALGGSTATPAEGITTDVVVVNNFDEFKALPRDQVAGKIVLFNAIFDKQKSVAGFSFAAYSEAGRYRIAGPKAAAELGAAAALVRSLGDADFRLPHTGFSFPAEIPAGAVTAEDADLIAHLAAQGRVRMRLTLTPQKLPDVTSYNVIADLKGSEHPEQVVIVSGHLDSWDLGTGAIDDGAGVVVAMEAAEVLQKLHLRPKRTLRVIAWMDEETGGSGSAQYSKDHSAEFSNYTAAIESDSGGSHPLGFGVRMSTPAADLLRPALNTLQSIGSTYLEISAHSPDADITDMSDAGVPALGLKHDGRNYFHYHHTAADTLDKVVPAELREGGATMAVMGYALASIKDPLPR